MIDRKDPETDAEKEAEAKAAEMRAAEMTKAAQAKREKWKAAHTTAEMTEAEAQAADTWPKIYGNINVPPLIVHSPDEAEQLGSAWVEVDLAGHGFALTPAP
jgi:hypothetical protein